MIHWFRRYWAWAVPLAWLIGYEIWAALKSHRKTLSELIWKGRKGFPALPWIVIPVVALLLLHFFGGLWQPPNEPTTYSASPSAPTCSAEHVPDSVDARAHHLDR